MTNRSLTTTFSSEAPGAGDAARVEDLARRMVAFESVTGTPGEAAFSAWFHDLLMKIPYFRDHPEDIRLIDSHGSPVTQNVVALVRGTGTRAIALAGHFDTVAIANYHDLMHLACNPARLKDALITDLSSRPLSKQEERALSDLLSGDFVPGRGMLDMKSGVAAGLACLERFAADPDRRGNMMLVVSPDEERESRGMRSLRDALPAIAAELGVTISAALNLDATSDQGNGADGRSVYAGTIGKLLPFALVIGRSSHASYPFEGVSALAMAAGILARFEGNAALADRNDDDISPPPICLEARDLRESYEVTTPERFWIAFNWLYHAMPADVLFERFRREVQAGAEEAVARFAGQAADYGKLTGKSAGATPPAPRLLTLAELRQAAANAVGDNFAALYAAEEAKLAGVDNPLAVSRTLANWLANAAALSGPAIVIGFAGLHYPPSHLDPARRDDAALKRAIDTVAAELAADPERSLKWRPYFQGISDMSFLGQAAPGTDTVAANTPASRLVDKPPKDALRFPAVNIGPWGREFHQRLERVHGPYAFDVLPRVLSAIVERYFATTADEI